MEGTTAMNVNDYPSPHLLKETYQKVPGPKFERILFLFVSIDFVTNFWGSERAKTRYFNFQISYVPTSEQPNLKNI